MKISNSRFWLSLALVALTLAVFLQVRHFDFVQYDDPQYVTENTHIAGGLSVATVQWALTTNEAANWHPLTWISHALDVGLFGLNPGAHHLSSLFFHVLNTLALFWLLCWMTSATWPSAFVSALFAVHPLHVESVAWVAERKDVLSTFFWLVTTWAYVAWVRRPSRARYAAIVVFFALGLMSKSMLVTLPFTLLLLDFWPLRRLGAAASDDHRGAKAPRLRKRGGKTDVAAGLQPRGRVRDLVIEKLPLFALAAASSIVTLIVQRQGGAVSALADVPFSVRIANVLTSYFGYLEKTVWPVNLAGFYSLQREFAASQVLMAIAVLAALTVVAVQVVRRAPYVLVGWSWFLGTLVPVIGIVQVGVQGMADRYTYVPLIGIFVAVAWVVKDVAGGRPFVRWAAATLAVGVVAVLSVRAHAQAEQWKDSTTFWTRATTVGLSVSDFEAHLGVGRVLSDQGRSAEAYEHFSKAVELKPDSGSAHYALGLTAFKLGRPDEAIASLTRAVTLEPTLAGAQYSLALVLTAQGRRSEAKPHAVEAVRLQPDSAEMHSALGSLLIEEKKIDEARAEFAEAVRLKPDLAGAHNNLGIALAMQGRMTEAIAHFTEAVRLDPTLETAQTNLKRALAARGR